MTSEQRLNQHVCEDDFAHAAVERAQGSACPRPRAAAAVSACLVSSSGTSAGARRPWRRPWRSRLRQHRRLRLHCRLLRRGRSRGKRAGGSRCALEEGDRFVAGPTAAHPVFRPPWRFLLVASQSFCSKRVGEETSFSLALRSRPYDLLSKLRSRFTLAPPAPAPRAPLTLNSPRVIRLGSFSTRTPRQCRCGHRCARWSTSLWYIPPSSALYAYASHTPSDPLISLARPREPRR